MLEVILGLFQVLILVGRSDKRHFKVNSNDVKNAKLWYTKHAIDWLLLATSTLEGQVTFVVTKKFYIRINL